jgi:very-short-patch-repair endonuclease
MSSDALRLCRDLAQSQGGVISRQEALGCGVSPDVLDRLLRTGRWQKVHRGVYLITADRPAREALLWAAVHRAGLGAALSHETAGELFELVDEPCPLIHVSIPGNRRVSPMSGVVVHISGRLSETTHPSLLPPRTRLEETVLDLVEQAGTFDAALGIMCSACQRRLTTVRRLVEAMGRRAKLRWRSELTKALSEIGTGVHSVLEYRYLHKVELAHGLPVARRQAKINTGGRSRYLDNLYEGYSLCVELDGLQAHPNEQRWQDIRRINAITENGQTVLRYGWIDVDRYSCPTTAQVATVLRRLGWKGTPHSCGPTCTLFRGPSR